MLYIENNKQNLLTNPFSMDSLKLDADAGNLFAILLTERILTVVSSV